MRRLSVFVAILGLSIGTAAAQEVNARAALQASLLKLDVAQHVPVHGRVGTNEEFVRLFTNTARTN